MATVMSDAADKEESLVTYNVSVLPTILEVSYNWVDITPDFFKSTKDLELGELLHDDSFGLFEAMSAIEMMDPKMDAGMLCNRGNKVMNFDQAVKAGRLKLSNLTMEELVGVLDTMFACLVTWLEGHSAAQTILTCLYLHKPLSIGDRTLRAFSIHMLKLLALINKIVSFAGVFEEEDFQNALYGYGVVPEVTAMRSAGMVLEVEDELQRTVKSSRNRNNEPWEPKMQKQHEDAVALFSRVRFLRLFYSALTAIQRKDSTSVAEAERFLASCCELVCIMQNTIHRGIKPAHQSKDSSKDGQHSNKSDFPVMMGFEPLVNQRLLPLTFPRYTKLRSRREAMAYLEETVGRIRQSLKVQHCTNFQESLEFLEKFSEGRSCVLSRSLAQLMYNSVWSSAQMSDSLRDSARAFICPPALLPNAPVLNNPEAKGYVDAFFTQCVSQFERLIVTCGHNRARQRDKIARLLEDFAALQDEADKLDAYLHNVLLKSEQPRPHLAYLFTWVLFHTLKLMLKYLLSGFTLQLYAVHEYHYIYWYLYEFVYVWLLSALSRADAMLIEQEGHDRGVRPVGRSRGKAKPRRARHRPYGAQINYYTALQHVCGGYFKALVGLRVAGKVRLPTSEFDNEEFRYEHRFLPFRAVTTPPPLAYEQFLLMTDLSNYPKPVTAESLYHDARNHFCRARSFLEAINSPSPEVSQLLKVVKTNFVVLRLLEGGHRAAATFDFSTHQCFPIIKV